MLYAVDVQESPEATQRTYWTLADRQGNVRDVYAVEGGAPSLETYDYDDFGEVTTTLDAFDVLVVRFQGRPYDLDLNAYNFRARWLMPGIQRFLSEDPAGDVDGPNRYTAFLNSPYNYRDPEGTLVMAIAAAATIGMGLYTWYHNVIVLDDIRKDRPSDPEHLLYNYDTAGDWHVNRDYVQGTAKSAAIAATLPVAAYYLPTYVTVAGGTTLAGYGVYQGGRAAIDSYREGNYFQAGYHTVTAALSAYGGARIAGPTVARAGSAVYAGMPASARAFVNKQIVGANLLFRSPNMAYARGPAALTAPRAAAAGSRTGVAPATRGIGEPVLFGQRRVSPSFSVDDAYPKTSGRSLADVVADLRKGDLTPDDLPLTAFRHPDTGALVSMNTRTRAVLAEAGLEPSRVSIVDLGFLSAKQQQKYLIRLGESPLIDSPLPGVRVPVTPSMNDLRIMSRPDGSPYIISIPGFGR